MSEQLGPNLPPHIKDTRVGLAREANQAIVQNWIDKGLVRSVPLGEIRVLETPEKELVTTEADSSDNQ